MEKSDFLHGITEFSKKNTAYHREEAEEQKRLYDLFVRIYPEAKEIISAMGRFDFSCQIFLHGMIETGEADVYPKKVMMDIFFGAWWATIKKQQKWEKQAEKFRNVDDWRTVFAGKNSQGEAIDVDIWYHRSISSGSYDYYGSSEYLCLLPKVPNSKLFYFDLNNRHLRPGCDFYGRNGDYHKPCVSFYCAVTDPDSITIKLPF